MTKPRFSSDELEEWQDGKPRKEKQNDKQNQNV
jgi:hypothetical protein